MAIGDSVIGDKFPFTPALTGEPQCGTFPPFDLHTPSLAACRFRGFVWILRNASSSSFKQVSLAVARGRLVLTVSIQNGSHGFDLRQG